MNPFETLSRWLRGDTAEVTPVYHSPGEAGRVLERLARIVDPELNLDIVSLGLVREVAVEDGRAYLTLTLTTEGCPIGPSIEDQVATGVADLGLKPEITWTFSPAWTPDHIRPGAEAVDV